MRIGGDGENLTSTLNQFLNLDTKFIHISSKTSNQTRIKRVELRGA